MSSVSVSTYSLHLRPVPHSTWITDSPSRYFSTLDLFDMSRPAERLHGHDVVAVRLNGVALQHHQRGKDLIVVEPCIPREGGRLEVICRKVPSGAPSKAPRGPAPGMGSGTPVEPVIPTFGLTPDSRLTRTPR